MDGYHLWYEEGSRGPFTLAQLRSMWASGQLTAENAFSEDGGQSWRYLAEIAGDLEPVPVAKIVASPAQNAPSPEMVEILKKIEKGQRANRGCVRAIVYTLAILIGLAIMVLLAANSSSIAHHYANS